MSLCTLLTPGSCGPPHPAPSPMSGGPVRENGQLQVESGKNNLYACDFETPSVCPYLGNLVCIFFFFFLIHGCVGSSLLRAGFL